jgi:CHAT domain-containing protein
LIAMHEIVNAPSASTLAGVREEALHRSVAPHLIAALGDPVFLSNYSLKALGSDTGNNQTQVRGADESLGDKFEPNKLQQLFYSKQELNELSKLAPAGQSIVYTDFAATRDNLKSLDLTQYRILHFATHGVLDVKQPELSGLVLSLVDRQGKPINGFVGLSDIYNLHAPVDLVVLSACRTALGKDERGEGLLSMTRGFMYAGASGVVASLWKVDDEATAELMKEFYANMLERGMPPAAALRAAQNTIRQQPNWQAPYYWAAFTLHGDYHQVIRPAPAYGRTFYPLFSGLSLLLLVVAGLRRYRRRRRAI